MGTGLAMALKAGLTYGPAVIEAITDLISRFNNGAVSQEEFEAEWDAMKSDWVNYSNRWEEAKKKAAELRAAEGSN